MEKSKAIYPILEKSMVQQNLRNEHIAICINKSIRTVENKMNGQTPWLWDECVAIHATHFSNVPIGVLFSKAEEAA